MRCMNCYNYYDDNIIFKIIDKNRTICLCPNCSAIMEQEGTLKFENDLDLVCEVTGKEGAVIFSSGNEMYTLDKDIMHRLLKYNLKPKEYKILQKKKSHLGFHYMIHDDFYTEKGIAIQPLDD